MAILDPKAFRKNVVVNNETLKSVSSSEKFQRQPLRYLPENDKLNPALATVDLARKYFRPQIVFDAPETQPKYDSEQAYLNKRVLVGIEFSEGSYFLEGDQNKRITYPRFRHPGVIIQVRRDKTYVQTKMAGSRASVIQDLGLNPYSIEIRGWLIYRNAYELPYEQMKALLGIYEAPNSVPVISDYLDRVFGIKDIYMYNLEFGMEEGVSNAVTFTLSAISDEPIELIINE